MLTLGFSLTLVLSPIVMIQLNWFLLSPLDLIIVFKLCCRYIYHIAYPKVSFTQLSSNSEKSNT